MAFATRITVLFLLLLVLLTPQVKAQPAGSTMNIVVNRDTVAVSFSFVLEENLTSLPLINDYVVGSNSTVVSQHIQQAMDRVEPGVSVEQLTMQVRTSQVSAPLNLWVLQENYSFIVRGANTNYGSSVRSDLSFLSMNMSDSINLGANEINNIGLHYLLGPLDALQTQPRTAFFVNGHRFINKFNPDFVTSRFSILDLAWIPPVSQWTKQTGPLDSSSIWTTSHDAPYNLTIGLTQVESIYIPIYLAVLDPTLRLSTNADAWINGTSVYFNLPATAEIVMPILMGVFLATALGSTLVDRTLTKGQRSKRKKR